MLTLMDEIMIEFAIRNYETLDGELVEKLMGPPKEE